MRPPDAGSLRLTPPEQAANRARPRTPADQFAAIIDAASDAILAVDGAFRIVLFNEAAGELFAVPEARALGTDLRDLLAEPTRTALEEAAAACGRSGERHVRLHGRSFRARRADGTEFPFEASLSRYEDRGESRLLLILRDVTAQQLAHEEIERSLSVMQATLDATTDGILVTSLAGQVIARNDRFLEMWGLERRPLPIGPGEVAYDDMLRQLRDRDAFLARARAIVGAPDEDSFDVIELADGRVFERTSRPQRMDGRSVGRVWSFRDVTERHRAQQELARSEASFRDFVEHSPYAIYRAARNGEVIAANAAMVRLLGYDTPEALLGVNLGRDVYVPEAGQSVVLAFERPEGLETRWRRRDGSIVWVRVSGLVVNDPALGVDYFEGFAADVTPLRDAEQARRQSEKLAAIGQLVSGVAHELNNPLSAILSFAEDLLQDPRTPSDEEALGMIHAQAQRSRAIVRDLLSFVRSRAGERERIDVGELVDGVLRSLRAEAARLGATLHARTDGPAAAIVGERAGIEQVLTNLVMNAAQSAGAGGRVWITVRCPDASGACEVCVHDDGPGIPEGVMARIFDPFFTTKPTGAGTGLGLSVSLGIVEQHGGTLTAENDPAGGARFTMRLPRAGDEVAGTAQTRGAAEPVAAPTVPPAAAPTPLAPATNAEEKPRALIIDDEATIRAALRRFFTRRGWIVDEAEDGRVALTRLLDPDTPAYRAVISDLRMPGLSGMELHDRLAELKPDVLARLVFSTGDVVSPEAADFVKRTHCPVLQKPFELSRLVEILQGFGA